METVIHRGSAVKALPNGHIEGYLVVFGDAATHDLSAEKDFFTAQTDFCLEDGMKSAVYFAHALDPTLKNRRLTNVSMTVDDVGVWVEGVMKARDEYEAALLKMAQEGKMGWSSGTAPHLVTRKAIKTDTGTVHEILSWPLGLDASLTPCPAEPRAAAAYTLKSLAAMIEAESTAPAATKSRADFTYDDLRALLESEWNEDFPPQMTYGDPYDGWARQVHIVAMDDATCVGQRGWDGELIRRSYSVTAGNDVMWGEPEEVARTTSFVLITDGDDPAESGGMSMMKTIKTEGAPAALPFGEHLDTALAAVEGVIERGFDINDLRIKSGRVLSAANRSKLKDMHTQMQTAHAAMASHITKMGDLLAATDPDGKKDVDDFAALRTRFVRLQSELLHMSG